MSEQVIIAKATVSDKNDILELEQKNSKRPYSFEVISDIFFGDYLILKAQKKEKIIGYAVAKVIFDEAEIINIVVDKDQRGKGVGKELLKSLVEYCNNSGARRIFLEVEESNFTAINLYSSFGFKQIHLRKNYYEEFSALIMEYDCDKNL